MYNRVTAYRFGSSGLPFPRHNLLRSLLPAGADFDHAPVGHHHEHPLPALFPPTSTPNRWAGEVLPGPRLRGGARGPGGGACPLIGQRGGGGARALDQSLAELGQGEVPRVVHVVAAREVVDAFLVGGRLLPLRGLGSAETKSENEWARTLIAVLLGTSERGVRTGRVCRPPSTHCLECEGSGLSKWCFPYINRYKINF